jgi:hypothetical protein
LDQEEQGGIMKKARTRQSRRQALPGLTSAGRQAFQVCAARLDVPEAQAAHLAINRLYADLHGARQAFDFPPQLEEVTPSATARFSGLETLFRGGVVRDTPAARTSSAPVSP